MILNGKGFRFKIGRIGVADGVCFPCISLFEKRFEKCVIERVTGFMEDYVSQYGHSEKREIADGIQNLVPDKLVVVSKAIIIEYFMLVDHNHIVQGAASGKPVLSKVLDFMQKSECSSSADFRFKHLV